MTDDERRPPPKRPSLRDEPDAGEPGFWDAYWERFHRQQVDDPIEERREGMWDRFKRQDVDDPVGRRS